VDPSVSDLVASLPNPNVQRRIIWTGFCLNVFSMTVQLFISFVGVIDWQDKKAVNGVDQKVARTLPCQVLPLQQDVDL
jgi:uncharacterized PurR-regulated membrane protein YhhQ (DUF165 family)